MADGIDISPDLQALIGVLRNGGGNFAPNFGTPMGSPQGTTLNTPAMLPPTSAPAAPAAPSNLVARGHRGQMGYAPIPGVKANYQTDPLHFNNDVLQNRVGSIMSHYNNPAYQAKLEAENIDPEQWLAGRASQLESGFGVDQNGLNSMGWGSTDPSVYGAHQSLAGNYTGGSGRNVGMGGSPSVAGSTGTMLGGTGTVDPNMSIMQSQASMAQAQQQASPTGGAPTGVMPINSGFGGIAAGATGGIGGYGSGAGIHPQGGPTMAPGGGGPQGGAKSRPPGQHPGGGKSNPPQGQPNYGGPTF